MCITNNLYKNSEKIEENEKKEAIISSCRSSVRNFRKLHVLQKQQQKPHALIIIHKKFFIYVLSRELMTKGKDKEVTTDRWF
jgi:hypothetical protein